jgi:hypothetical protein
MCCTLPAIPEIGKPAGAACPHATGPQGASCTCYKARPVACRKYVCLWAASSVLPEKLRPDLCGFYVEPLRNTSSVVLFNVDPLRPDAWKTGIGKSLVDRYVAQGTAVAAVVGKANHYALPPDTAFTPIWRDMLEAARAAGVR